MRKRLVMPAVMLLAVMAGIVPATGAGPVQRYSYCSGDGYIQILGDISSGTDDVWLRGHVGCSLNPGNWSWPMDIETILGTSTVGAAGACGADGVEGPLKDLRLRTTMKLTEGTKTHTAVRTWWGYSTGNFPGSNITGTVRDPSGAVVMGGFRLEFYPDFYCAYDLVSIRMWDVAIGPSPGL